MEDQRNQFTFYESFYKAISRIKKKADRADAFDAVCAYALYGIEPDLDAIPDSAAMAYIFSKPVLDAGRRKANSGKKGGEAKQTGSKPEANGKQGEPQSKKENKKENKKEDKCPPPIPPSLGGRTPVLESAFSKWLTYKAEKKQGYTPTGLQSLITQVRKHADQYGDQAVADLITTSMASNWQGIAFDRLRSNTPQTMKPGGSHERKPTATKPGEDITRMKKYLQQMKEGSHD